MLTLMRRYTAADILLFPNNSSSFIDWLGSWAIGKEKADKFVEYVVYLARGLNVGTHLRCDYWLPTKLIHMY